MVQASVNKNVFEIQLEENGFKVNNEFVSWDVQKLDNNAFHIILNNKSYTAEIVKIDRGGKSCIIKINGKHYPVELKDQFDLLLEKMGMNAAASSKVNNVKAPMPGLIIDLKVKDGDQVKAGDTLLILEAMKMENIIKSPGEGVVKAVKIKKGESVEKNQILIEF
ncbi:acetyl-CoA carboxylase biotin carboxyl carrier protein subunit [Chryseosolibacter indicus]|uniref:Biotin/lipoyl-binding protein n=1 Tax=Chryseosolibacter indicus TaxID=2782351 RepID=A0ABS5VNJ3_9BACT|nr:biotin/lipoyl-containing protein [Chryseosolibacter indicus]MBT1703008.1 biotin/lipoyl-binding protein [Chryseosolibacter indicus]